jgi:hypothetical protein
MTDTVCARFTERLILQTLLWHPLWPVALET